MISRRLLLRLLPAIRLFAPAYAEEVESRPGSRWIRHVDSLPPPREPWRPSVNVAMLDAEGRRFSLLVVPTLPGEPTQQCYIAPRPVTVLGWEPLVPSGKKYSVTALSVQVDGRKLVTSKFDGPVIGVGEWLAIQIEPTP